MAPDGAWVERELDRFDPGLPIEAAWTPPASWYASAEIHRLELRTVFRDSWLCAGRAGAVALPGRYLAAALPGCEALLVRGTGGELVAFHNVCRHRATRLAEGEGVCRSLVCPYHGWEYDLRGRLRRAPRAGGIEGFRREDFGLRPLGLEEWGPLVFVHWRPDAPPLPSERHGLLRDLETQALHFVTRREYRIACNWKVFVDNYLDGGYHVAVAHPDLAGQLDGGSYRVELFERHSVQSCRGAAAGGRGADFAERVGDRQRYAWLYPNLMLNRYGPVLDVNYVLPLGVRATRVVFEYFFEAPVAADERFVARCLEASDRVQREDIELCERVQAGLQSSAFERGRYAPKVESGELHFHRLLAADLRAAAAG